MITDTPVYFDAHCVTGGFLTGGFWVPPYPGSVPELLATMDRFGIGQALVTHSVSRCHHPGIGNDRLIAELAGEPRLVPAWVLLPSVSGETPSPDRLVDEMRAAGVRAAWLCPGKYAHALTDWEWDDTLAALAEAHVPVFLDGEDGFPGWGHGYALDSIDLDAAVGLARRHPTLPVVLTAFRFRHTQRSVAQALRAVPNLHLEMSGWWFYRSVEFAVQAAGPERVLFGSRLPFHDPAATKATLQYAELPDESRELIAGGNLRRLLAWDGEVAAIAPQPNEPEQGGELYRLGLAGADLPEDIVADCHSHMGRWAMYHVPNWTPDELDAEMERVGVELTCVFPLGGANDPIIEAQRRHPDRFIGFVRPSASLPLDAFAAEIERCIAAGLRGIKLFSPDEERVRIACRVADRERMLILNHNWGDPAMLLRLAQDYPNAVFITGHTRRDCVDVFREAPNVYMCTCPLIAFAATEWYVKNYGADRLLYGSDMSDLPHAWGFGPILYADISDADKRAVLGGNLRRLLETHSRSSTAPSTPISPGAPPPHS